VGARGEYSGSAVRELIVPSAARVASGDSGIIDGLAGYKQIRAQLNVTAAAGTLPTLDVTIEDTLDGTNWNTIGTFAQKTEPGREVISITGAFSDRARVKWVIGGTEGQSFTFAVAWSLKP
jgi:hypothetical protein